MFGHGVSRCCDALSAKGSLGLIFEGYDIRHSCCQFVRTTNRLDASKVVEVGLIVESVEVCTAQSHAIAVVEVASLAAVAKGIINAGDIHVHHRFVAVTIPHALPLGIGRKRSLGDVTVTVVGIV